MDIPVYCFQICPGSWNTVFNDAEGIHDFGDLCKYRHVRQTKEREPEQASVPPAHPWNKLTNRQTMFQEKNPLYLQIFMR